MLKMKAACERCQAQLGLTDEAYICSFECTFCPSCTSELLGACPKCKGHLVMRPSRRTSPTEVARPGFKAKLEKILS